MKKLCFGIAVVLVLVVLAFGKEGSVANGEVRLAAGSGLDPWSLSLS